MQATPCRKVHPGPGILPGAPAWSGVICRILATGCSIITLACSQSLPLQTLQSPRGPIQYTLNSPETPAGRHVILAHGFLRSPQTMRHLAGSLAEQGIETACIQLERSTAFDGKHAGNARDMIALREALGWKAVTYAGFSAGGLSALIAASGDGSCTQLLLLDPVDQGTLGRDAASRIRIPTLALLGQPGPGNARRNAAPMLQSIPGIRIVEIPEAVHCDFEARPSALCHLLTGSRSDPERTAAVHRQIFEASAAFLNPPNPSP